MNFHTGTHEVLGMQMLQWGYIRAHYCKGNNKTVGKYSVKELWLSTDPWCGSTQQKL